MRVLGVAKSASTLSLPPSISLLGDVLSPMRKKDIPTRIESLERRINLCDDNFILTSQKLSGYDKQFKSQITAASQLIQEIEVHRIKNQQNIEGVQHQLEQEVKDKVALYFQMNSNLLVTKLLTKKKHLKQSAKRYVTNSENITQISDQISKQCQSKQRQSLVPLLETIVRLQEAQIQIAKSVY
ncbi:hypothetical protein TVAG_459120 [Trichomonas vaginalis G3]|uniref:Uncharacterized protein n=1 Tax=Trichomonas vaginalis (strain ATCC PRA-98 / G3) TaxID=412133 RepID=A2E6B7_TRIV3|nr:hypothetical protein TVAGG3_0394770 [Trichomonas vaginalis G3]EAY11840.1 hypothetical protein TVAG_459120 [Trichomonas vaginalis G3]KAI5534258.1 hypothetical protein TVAGG3_0394770 [Trichomonas vaginalis G3]|eukprot:XP_001324063.1 hypothetical protein [Trichomonas vaginalis G3]